MRENSYGMMALTIADSSHHFQVVAVNGHDRLNAPFCFAIDLVCTDTGLNTSSFTQRSAYLEIGGSANSLYGIHGRVHSLQALHQGQTMSLYRLQLMPALQLLDGTPRRRVFNGQTVPHIIRELLQRVDAPDNAVRFDPLIGRYPPRAHCVQFDESDLHFLSRLCEEEGISFRFEHAPHQHTLVFSDDPMGFPEWPAPASVEHLAQRLSAKNCYSTHAGEYYAPSPGRPDAPPLTADNQAFSITEGPSACSGRQHQLRRRLLERLRCERCDVVGRSVQPWMRSGHVIRVDDHPDPHLNDQWLLTEVSHSAWQLEPLRSCTSLDVIQMLQAITHTTHLGNGLACLLSPQASGTKPPLAYYENGFKVIPWTLPFRPPLAHPKPLFSEVQSVTQVAAQAGHLPTVPIRYEWQTEPASLPSHARVVSGLAPQMTGARLQVRFIAGDPDQPLICGLAPDQPEQLDQHDPPPRGAQTQRLESQNPVILKGPRATLRITRDGVHYAPSDTARGVNDG